MNYKSTTSEGVLPRKIEGFHSKEFISFISQIGFVHPIQARLVFDQPDAIDNLKPTLQAILLAGKGQIAHLEGNFHHSQQLLEKALIIANSEFQKSDDDESRRSLAYVHFEYGKLHNILYSPDIAYAHFQQAVSLNPSAKLKLLLDVQISRIKIARGDDKKVSTLKIQVNRLKKAGLTADYILGLQRLGIIESESGRLDESEVYLTKSLELAEQGEFQYLQWTIKNAIGMHYKKQGKFKKALSYTEGFIDSVESHYLKTIVMKNLALYYRTVKEYDKSISTCKAALEYAHSHGVIAQTSGIACLAGKLIRNYTDKPGEAYHYFKMGYDIAIEQEKKGLPITRYKRQAVESYVNFIQNYLPKDFHKVSIATYFDWTHDKSWVQIQDLFYYNLFVYHFIHTGVGDATFKHLGVIKTTFYSTTKRMRDHRGITFPNFRDADMTLPPELYIDQLQKYVQLHRDKSYKEASAQFERDIYEYLFKENGYNKMRLSKSLDLSYSIVLKKTKPFTDLDTPKQKQLNAPEQI